MSTGDVEGHRSRARRITGLAVLALWAGGGRAQTTGEIIGVVTDASTGGPVSGARVVATGSGLPGAQTTTSDERGRYRLTLLPPGPYRLAATGEGFAPAARDDVVLRIDKTLRADLVLVPAQVTLPEQVVRTIAPAVDVARAEAAIVVPREAYEVLPLSSRTFEAALVLAPSARYGGGLDGAQAAENRVLVEGLDVSDPLDNRLYLALPANFVEQLDVKTGNYLPEYGRVTGGILSAVTRSGSNELHGSAFSSLTMRSSGQPLGRMSKAIWRRDLGSPNSYAADMGFELGGPIVKDRLWFHVGLDPAVARKVTERWLRANALDAGGAVLRDANGNPVMSDIDGTETRHLDQTSSVRFTGKLTWAPVEDHTFTLSVFGSPTHGDTFEDLNTPGYRQRFTADDLVVDAIARWTGRLLDKRLLAEAAVGWHLDDFRRRTPRSRDGVDLYQTPAIQWTPALPLGDFEPVPAACAAGPAACLVSGYTTGGAYWSNLRVERLQAKLALSWLGRGLGTHQVRGGADVEITRSTASDHLNSFSYVDEGDPALSGFDVALQGTLRAYPTASPDDLVYPDWVATRIRGISPALFLQDSWQPVPSLTLNGGLRWEAQDQENTLNGDPLARIRIRDSFAPRVQAIWDPSGQGRSKVAAAWGRYYETIPLSLGKRSFGSMNGFGARYQEASCPGGVVIPGSAPFDPRTACAALVPGGVQDALGNLTTVALFPGTTPVAPDLKGQYVDQFGATLEHELLPDLSLAIDYQGRRQGRVVEDLSNDGVSYFIANPGEGTPFSYTYPGRSAPLPLDPRGAATRDRYTGRAFRAGFPKPERSYDGITFRASKAWRGRWLAAASYTWSKLRGNYPGPASGNQTSQFDLPTLMVNQGGLLPADVPHVVKVIGARTLEIVPRVSLTLGAVYVGQSGTPANALGVYDPDHSVFILPRGSAGRTPFVSQLDLRVQLEIAIRAPYVVRLRLDVFNALDSRTPVSVDENYTVNNVLPMVGERCGPVNAIAAPNPAAALQTACPGLAYLRNLSGRPVAVNPNYGQPTGFQAQRSFQAGAEVSF